VKNNGLEVVKDLVEKDVGIVNSKLGDWTPLHLAAFGGNLEIVKFLVEKMEEKNIEKKDGIDHPSNDGFTPLHAASSDGHLEVVKFLIDKGANFQAVNDEGWTLLHAAAQNGRLSVVKYLINEKGFDVNILDEKNDTPLHTAAFHGKTDVVEYLFEKDANINAVDTLGAMPLFSAALKNNREIVKFLLEKGAKVFDTTDDKTLLGKLRFSVLHVAAMYDDNEMIEDLIEKGIDINIGKDSSLTPLHVAAFFGSFEAIGYLIKNGAIVDAYVQVSKVNTVCDSVKKDVSLKAYGIFGGIINMFIDVGSYILDKLHITPSFIYKAFDYPENKLLSEKQRNFFRSYCVDPATIMLGKKILNKASRQVDILKTFVNQNKDRNLSLPMDAAFLTEEAVYQEEKLGSVSIEECLPSTSKQEK
jgi:ankyrin repeat protein